ncbi:response regulator [Maritimibacter alexandrii]|uniref:response regulator n=1 Tax=Maritimibacter alexandrii TaxID=2570355 RepID=UPI001108B51B|nr:response regulator [Maritimibacter alexandrii]
MTVENPLILHVDDEEDILSVTRLALEMIGGLTVVQCNSGKSAIDLAAEREPDLFLLDVMMPDIDGPETLRALRGMSQFENTPAIFMTARVTQADEAMLKACGAVSVVKKPFDPMTLASEIIAIWNQSFQQEHVARI